LGSQRFACARAAGSEIMHSTSSVVSDPAARPRRGTIENHADTPAARSDVLRCVAEGLQTAAIQIGVAVQDILMLHGAEVSA
jgi:hypothetical protein